MSERCVFPRGLLPTEAVIVTDGNERSALAVVRSLGGRGVPVYVGADTVSSLAGVSRYCRGSFVYPSPWTHPHEYLASLLDYARRFHTGLIFPMTDIAVEILGEYLQGGGKEFTVPIPSLGDYQGLSNKFHLMAWSQQAEIPIPATLFIQGRQYLEAEIDKIQRWPVVVKPGRSVIKDGVLWKKTAVAVASNREALRQLYRERWYLKWPSLIQEQVIGFGEGVFGLFVDGKPTALFAHRRLREKPPSGGVSVLRESIPLPPTMTDYASRIMQSATWQGVAMVEFKVASDTGVPYLMEVNGRFWGSLQLAIDAGVDFPWLLYQLVLTGQYPNEIVPYQVGVKSRWWLGDVDHWLIRLKKSDSALNLPPGTPSKWKTLISLVRSHDPNTRSEVYQTNDPEPWQFELKIYLRSMLGEFVQGLYRRLAPVSMAVRSVWWDVGTRLGKVRSPMVVARVESITHMLLLCKGNICRSPFAAEYLRMKLQAARLGIEVVSAGLDTNAGDPADSQAQCSAAEFGIDLSRHRTAVVSGDMVARADLLIVMELAHKDMLFQSFPEARNKTLMLGHFARSPILNIADPFGKRPEVFRSCYGQLMEACDGLVSILQRAT